MSYLEFIDSLHSTTPPADDILRALWFDFKGQWSEAHELVDGAGTASADRVHAYLHRKEGDSWNARYWYNRIGESVPKQSLEEEWEYLVKKFTTE